MCPAHRYAGLEDNSEAELLAAAAAVGWDPRVGDDGGMHMPMSGRGGGDDGEMRIPMGGGGVGALRSSIAPRAWPGGDGGMHIPMGGGGGGDAEGEVAARGGGRALPPTRRWLAPSPIQDPDADEGEGGGDGGMRNRMGGVGGGFEEGDAPPPPPLRAGARARSH